MAAAAVLVASVAAGSILVTKPDRPGETAAPPVDTEATAFRLPFEVGDIPGYQTAMFSMTGTREWSVWITTDANVTAGLTDGPYELRVFPRGGFDPADDQAGEPVQVNGKPGFYRADMPCRCGVNVGVPSIGWEYASDSWALVQFPANSSGSDVVAPPDVREILMSMATAVRFDRTTPFRVPFRVGYLPPDLRPSASNRSSTRPVTGIVYVDVDLDGPGDRTLSVSTPGVTADPDAPVGEPVVIDNMLPLTVAIDVGQVTMYVSGEGYTADELKKVARSIRPVTDVENPKTWLDADNAIPLR
jgi:hypothetical protein